VNLDLGLLEIFRNLGRAHSQRTLRISKLKTYRTIFLQIFCNPGRQPCGPSSGAVRPLVLPRGRRGAGLIALWELGLLGNFTFYAPRKQSDRLAIWTVLVCLGVIGWLHNANSWTHEGVFFRPRNIALWKTELVLVIALAGPLLHWLASATWSQLRPMDGQKFALEFVLYVNFSGIATRAMDGRRCGIRLHFERPARPFSLGGADTQSQPPSA